MIAFAKNGFGKMLKCFRESKMCDATRQAGYDKLSLSTFSFDSVFDIFYSH